MLVSLSSISGFGKFFGKENLISVLVLEEREVLGIWDVMFLIPLRETGGRPFHIHIPHQTFMMYVEEKYIPLMRVCCNLHYEYILDNGTL
jgi:hypothetical protein